MTIKLTDQQNTIIEGLKALKSGMAPTYLDLVDRPSYAQMTTDDVLEKMVEDALDLRNTNRINLLMRRSKLRFPAATVAEIEYFDDRDLDRKMIENLAAGRYLQTHANIVLMGASGSGKTYLACALGNSACRQGNTVLYERLPEFLENMETARLSGDLRKTIDKYARPKLLILDDFLLTPLSDREAGDLFEVMEKRWDKASTILCAQFEVQDWYERIGTQKGATVTESFMDRTLHTAHKILIRGDVSMRERHSSAVLDNIAR